MVIEHPLWARACICQNLSLQWEEGVGVGGTLGSRERRTEWNKA